MVDGGDNIREASWESVSSMLQVVSNPADVLIPASVVVELNSLWVTIRVEL